MEYAEAFGPDVTPREFFLEKLPALHESRLDVFELYSETILRLSVRLTDLQEQYTVELGPDGARVREGDMIEFPVATLEGTSQHWDAVKKQARAIFEKAEKRIRDTPPADRVTEDFLRALESYDAVIALELTGKALNGKLKNKIILNDYEPPPGGRRLKIYGSLDLIWEVLEGRKSATEAADALELSDDIGLAFEMGGLMMNHFPRLDE